MTAKEYRVKISLVRCNFDGHKYLTLDYGDGTSTRITAHKPAGGTVEQTFNCTILEKDLIAADGSRP